MDSVFFNYSYQYSDSKLDRTNVVFNIMPFTCKPLVKIEFGPLQSNFYALNTQTVPNFEWYSVLKTRK